MPSTVFSAVIVALGCVQWPTLSACLLRCVADGIFNNLGYTESDI